MESPAYLDGEIFVTQYGQTTVLDYAAGQVRRPLNATNGFVHYNLSRAGDRMLAVQYEENPVLLAVDRRAGTLTPAGVLQGPFGHTRSNAVIGDELFVGGEGGRDVSVFDLSTLALKRTFPLPEVDGVQFAYYYVGGSAGSFDVDRYTFGVDFGDRPTLTTETPGDGAGDFVNDLDPMLVLYGPDGQVVAVDDNYGRHAASRPAMSTAQPAFLLARAAEGDTGDDLQSLDDGIDVPAGPDLGILPA